MRKSSESLWLRTVADPGFPALTGDATVDVCVVGGGMAGVTAARLLQRAGKRVALLDQGKIGNGVTGFTTAHLTEALDTRYFELRKTFGNDGARLAAQSHRAAIEHIARTVDEEKLDCGFRYLPGYLYSEESPDQIVQEHEAARACGIEVAVLDRAPLPFPTKKALRFERQGQFHPLRYLLPLARQVAQRGGLVHEQTRALDVRDGEPCTVRTAQGLVRATQVLVCTHTPVNDKFFMHTKLAQYRSYVVTARPVQRIDGLFWADADPYHYLRMHDGQLIAGGEGHKVGQKANTNEAYDRLGEYVRPWCAPADALESVARGEGRIVTVAGKKVAAFRDEDGKLTLLSPTSTHMACTVRWNPAEKSWDCPCHGARYDVEGEVLNGPAIKPLAKKQP